MDFLFENAGWIMGAVFLLASLVHFPLFVTISVVSLLGFNLITYGEFSIENSTDLMLEMFRITESEIFLAIPFFTLAGAIMTHGTISDRLVAIARAFFGWMPGGLAIACIMACVFFAALSGSSAVTIIAIGGILMPALAADGYPSRFSLGLLTTCGALGVLAPPSLPLIIYGVVAQTDIGNLFIAGMFPGLLTIAMLSIYCLLRGLRLPAREARTFDAREAFTALRKGFFALMLPFIMLGGIYGGLMTPTEASVVAVIYAIFVEVVIHRDVKLTAMPEIVSETMTLVGTILIILLSSMAFTSFITDEQIPLQAADWMKEHVHTQMGFLTAVNILLLIVGALMDIFSALILVAPLVVPIAIAYDVNLVHLGIIFVINLEIGFATPPFGINLFISSNYFRKSVGEVFIATAPFLLLLLVSLGLVTYFPAISLSLVPDNSNIPTPAEMFKMDD